MGLGPLKERGHTAVGTRAIGGAEAIPLSSFLISLQELVGSRDNSYEKRITGARLQSVHTRILRPFCAPQV